MISSKLCNALLLLLRQGLWEQKEDTAGLFPLSPDEWQQVYGMARKQTVQGIVYDGINLLDPSLFPPRPLLLQWIGEIDMVERKNHIQSALLEALYHLFDGRSAPAFRLLKGQGLAAFYRKPLHRVCGDLDLWFDGEEKMEAACHFLEQRGVPVHRGGNGDASCVLNGVLVELHSRLIELHSPFMQQALAAYEHKAFASSRHVPEAVANHLLQSTHILKHLINSGIGLRQLCDVAMSLAALHEETDGKELKKLSKRWHIYRWNRLLYSLPVKYLGMPARYLPFPAGQNPDRLMEEIWKTGNFGHGDERYGNRPQGKWANKRYTLKQITGKMHLSLEYAAHETCWWLAGLSAARIKELFYKKDTGNKGTK